MAMSARQNVEPAPVNVVGSSVFGRYPKISAERTYNMFISDGWLVNYAGFKKRLNLLPMGQGRALFKSVRGNFILAIESSTVYKLNANLAPIFIGQINTTTGDVFIAENLANQICIVDGESAYIYNYLTGTFTKQTLTFLAQPIIPSCVCYHNSFFLIGSSKLSQNSQNWYVFERDTDSTIKLNKQLSIQTKSDFALAINRLPGKGNNVLVLGSTVGEVWTQVGGAENYRRVQSFNIDSGTVSVSTIAASEELICWLSQNENNSPSIMITDGSSTKRISTDGIDFLLSTIKHPEQSTAFFYRQDGQLTFYHASDNLTLVYDFNTELFFDIRDDKMNYHPARDVVYFNEKTYFISINDASIYEMNSTFISYDYSTDITSLGQEIPRIRICKSIRKEDSSIFRARMFTFWIEQGVNKFFLSSPENGFILTQDGGFVLTQQGGHMLTQQGDFTVNNNIPRVDMSFSKNGNQSFSNVVGRDLNPAGNFRNQIRWRKLGRANEFTVQLRFWGFQRFVCSNGILEVY